MTERRMQFFPPGADKIFGYPSASYLNAEAQQRQVGLLERQQRHAEAVAKQEHELSLRQGGARARTLQALGEDLESGRPPNEAMSRLMANLNTPEGAADLAADPDFADNLLSTFNDWQQRTHATEQLDFDKDRFGQKHALATRTEGRIAANEGDRIDLDRAGHERLVARDRIADQRVAREDQITADAQAALGRSIHRFGQLIDEESTPEAAVVQLFNETPEDLMHDGVMAELTKQVEWLNKQQRFGQEHALATQTEERITEDEDRRLDLTAGQLDVSQKDLALRVVQEQAKNEQLEREAQMTAESREALGRATQSFNQHLAAESTPQEAFVQVLTEMPPEDLRQEGVLEELRAQVGMLAPELTRVDPGQPVLRSELGRAPEPVFQAPTTAEQQRDAGILSGPAGDLLNMAQLAQLPDDEVVAVAREMILQGLDGGSKDDLKIDLIPADEFNERMISVFNRRTLEVQLIPLGQERRPPGGVEPGQAVNLTEAGASSGTEASAIKHPGLESFRPLESQRLEDEAAARDYAPHGLDSEKYRLAEMFMGAGVGPIVKRVGGNIARQLGSESGVGIVDSNRRQAYDQVRAQLIELRPEGALAVGQRMWNLIENRWPEWGFMRDPLDAVGDGLMFYQDMLRTRDALEERAARATTASARTAAIDGAEKAQGILDSMPIFKDMELLQEDLLSGQLRPEPLGDLGEIHKLARETAENVSREASGEEDDSVREFLTRAMRDPLSVSNTELQGMLPNLSREEQQRLLDAIREAKGR